MIWACVSLIWSQVNDFTEEFVPTGIKIGVSISPWGVFKRPALAPVSLSLCKSS